MSQFEDLPDEVLLQICKSMDDQTLGRSIQTYKRISQVCNEEIERRTYILRSKATIGTEQFIPVLSYQKDVNGNVDESLINFFKDAQSAGLLNDGAGNPIDISLLVKGYTTLGIISSLLAIYLYNNGLKDSLIISSDIIIDDRIIKWFNPSFIVGKFDTIMILLFNHATVYPFLTPMQDFKLRSVIPELQALQADIRLKDMLIGVNLLYNKRFYL